MRTLATFLILFALSAPLIAEKPADRIVIEKAARRLTLYRGDTKLHEYKIALGTQPTGPKRQQGDHRTPEGHYSIVARNSQSRFYKALKISYPGKDDLARAKQRHVNPGGDIMIHGLPNGWGLLGKAYLLHDWTDGCIAVTNEEMDEIWPLVRIGTPVEILP